MRDLTLLSAALPTAVAMGVATLMACHRADDPGGIEFRTVVLDHLTTCGGTSGFSDNPASPNPFFPITPGRTWVLEGEDGGETIRLTIEVTNRTEPVGGVTTRVVTESEGVVGQPVTEISENYFAQASDGTVCYFGELDLDGSGWRADGAGNHAGIIMPASPTNGVEYAMEDAPGVAEDQGRIVGGNGKFRFGGASFDAIRVRETNPLEGGSSEIKSFASGIGTVVDSRLTLVSCSGSTVAPCNGT